MQLSDIDAIMSHFCIYKNEVNIKVSIADILGCDFKFNENNRDIAEFMSEIFDKDGDGYHRRSCGLLDYSSEEILEKLEKSFKSEPLRVFSVKNNKHIISTNGLHRFSILKFHLLNKTAGLDKNSKEYKTIIKEYTIPVYSEEVDLEKTFSSFLLSCFGSYSVRNEYNESYENTGNLVVENYIDDEEMVVSKEELIEFTKKEILAINDEKRIKELHKYQEESEYLSKFINTYIPQMSINMVDVNDEENEYVKV